MAPEVGKAADDAKQETFYDDRADVWSLGMLFGELLTGKRLPNYSSQQRFPYMEGVSNSLIDIACKMIIRDHTKRPFVH
jgi:serine/threonine protein kinase